MFPKLHYFGVSRKGSYLFVCFSPQLLITAYILWILATFVHLQRNILSLFSDLLLPYYKDPCDYMEPIQMIKVIFDLKILNFIMSAKFLLPYKIIFLDSRDRTWSSLGTTVQHIIPILYVKRFKTTTKITILY